MEDNRMTLMENQLANLTKLFKLHQHLGSDLTQPLAGKKSYGGRVDPTASTASVLPAGWTISVNGSTHVYTLTHNLGTTSYSVVATSTGSNAITYFVPIHTYHANTFVIEFDTAALVAGTTDWTFILITI